MGTSGTSPTHQGGTPTPLAIRSCRVERTLDHAEEIAVADEARFVSIADRRTANYEMITPSTQDSIITALLHRAPGLMAAAILFVQPITSPSTVEECFSNSEVPIAALRSECISFRE